MAKSKKRSKSHTSGLLPNFRTGRTDSKLAVSKNSRTLKSLSLNTEDYDDFRVPLEVLSLSKMSRIERKNLKLRLKMELEQVRKFLKKVAPVNSDLPALSASSAIRSCNGQERSESENQHRLLEVSATQAKKRASLGHNGPKNKRRIETMKIAAQVTSSNAMLMKQCQALLDCLMSRQYAWVFNTPVDIVELEIPDYFTVIKHPMDLGTVKSRITSSQYSSPMDFAADVRLTFSNAMSYNPPGNDVHIMAKTLSKYFEMRWKAIEEKIPVANMALKSSKPTTGVGTEISDRPPPLKKKKIRSDDTDVMPEPVKRIMTDDEKHKLSLELEALLGELPTSIANFLKEHSYRADETNDDEIEIDIDALSEETLVQLRKLLDSYMLEKQKVHEKAEPCKVKLLNESLPLCIGNEPVEEDVDIIGGCAVPVVSYPALAIEKDGATANTNRCSNSDSSSSSSSECGSSSNGSDMSSSSGTESDAAEVSKTPSELKENVASVLTLDPGKGIMVFQKQGRIQRVSLRNEGVCLLLILGHDLTFHAVTLFIGESASERQVPPEKLSRAALLRSRFADTILKAKETALEKQDPHKPIIGREQLERRRTEKAQLEAKAKAKAKAAEEAQRKAEAEAAAAAKRRREQEREAARQALKHMEKTVDINENSQLLKDLEMLGIVNNEHLPSFPEKARPDHLLNGLSSFKLKVGSDPLGQLGLCMKFDDDEDENDELSQSTNGAEGEID
ncbi:transcription factor GTE10-like [Neltuma alba]|uniref:transcription factor GTE10-like n=1 Tax=Neltuma alba TaxID=207710 RepID=UPI0010A52454|nr:transcription factor GTE10-like [Prosopis alba]